MNSDERIPFAPTRRERNLVLEPTFIGRELEARLRFAVVSASQVVAGLTLESPPTAPKFTAKQGQDLAFIYYYTKIHGAPPAEADLQRYFRVSPPAVHQMIVTLAARAHRARARASPIDPASNFAGRATGPGVA